MIGTGVLIAFGVGVLVGVAVCIFGIAVWCHVSLDRTL